MEEYIKFRIFLLNKDKRTLLYLVNFLQGYGEIYYSTKPRYVIQGYGPKFWLMHRLAQIQEKNGDIVKIEWREIK